MSDKPTDLPDVTYGGKPPPDWRKAEQDDTPDDDEDLAETPSDVVAMLGFDPKELDKTERADQIAPASPFVQQGCACIP